MTTPWLPRTVSLPRCHFPFSPVFRLPVVLGGQPRSKVEAFVENSKGKGTVPGGKREEVPVVRVLVENTGGGATSDQELFSASKNNLARYLEA